MHSSKKQIALYKKYILLIVTTSKASNKVQNSEKKNEKDFRQVENNGSKSKSKEIHEGFTMAMLRTLISHQQEQNRNSEWKKPNSSTSSKQSHGKDWMENAGYEDEQNWPKTIKEVLNWKKEDPTPNNEARKCRQNKSPSNDSERKLDWRNNNNYSSPKTSSPQSLNDKKNLVFDKRDFLFSDIPKKLREQIQLDEVAKYSVTDMRTADRISNFIAKLDGLNEHNIVITDGTACAGGNTISFCKKFKKVQAVELDRNRYEMLMHNLKILECTNATCYHANYLELVCSLTQDIVFLDPPWGGPAYKEKKEVELFLGNVPLDKICEKLKSRTKYIIIKAPTNLNYEKFKAKISGNLRVLHEFPKMILIVVDYYIEAVRPEQITNNYNKDDGKTNKETYKSHNTDAKSHKTTSNVTYADVAAAAAKHAVGYCSDYVCDDYAYNRAYKAALAVVRAGDMAAYTAATAAYFDATDDVARADDYDDPCAANAYLRFADAYDYYVADVDNSVDDADGGNSTNGADGDNSVNDADRENGANGDDGDNGANADDGDNGANVDDGDNGANVDDGDNGANGGDDTYRNELDVAIHAPFDNNDDF